MSVSDQKIDTPVHARTLDFYDVHASSAIKPDAKKLLHEYSKIPESEIDEHIEDIVCTICAYLYITDVT
jgi:hypothetical protein